MEAIRETARERPLPLVDHAAHWRAHPQPFHYWMSDPFHPNNYGHIAMAHLLFQSLGIFDPASPSCRLFCPL
jgi:lysophospholipase L1-like esterase